MSEKTSTSSVAVNGGEDAFWDVIIIGSGISGINAAYRLQTQCAGLTYTVIESRSNMGGTWDFWKYPGIRSDSDLYTFGFPWRPWPNKQAIASGESIVEYLHDSARETGIDKKIQYQHKLTAASWSSKQARWTLSVQNNNIEKTYTAKFIIIATGYYDYENPLPASVPGLENFKGTVVHPQFWPEKLDYTDKDIIVVGSGATAITLLPALATKAKHITMVQRSPSYIMSLPTVNKFSELLHRILPSWMALQLIRIQFLVVPYVFSRYCRAFPNSARRVMRGLTTRQLPKNVSWEEHFNPSYSPWEQRLCVCPDGDFYRALRSGKTSVATGHIKTVREHDVLLQSGETVKGDILVTATGLKIHLAGGAHITVDGETLEPGKKFLWRGVMLQDLPNASFIIGYTNASWTLGADATAQMATKLLRHMARNGYRTAVPRLDKEDEEKMVAEPTMNLKSTYIQEARDLIPKSGDKKPWLPRSSYFSDIWGVWFANYKGLEFKKE